MWGVDPCLSLVYEPVEMPPKRRVEARGLQQCFAIP